MINFPMIIFNVFAVLAVLSALMVVVSSNPVRGALFLVLTFVNVAALWLMAHAEFLAMILIVVYVGAVMTLFLFVVMMLRLDVKSSEWRSFRQVLFGLFGAAIVGGILTVMLQAESFQGPIHLFGVVTYVDLGLTGLGRALFQDNVYPFEIAGALLLVAIIAAIALAFRGKQQRLSQNTNAQIARRREDAVRMLKMPSEKK